MRRFMILPVLVLAGLALFTAWNHSPETTNGPLDRELAQLQLVRDHASEGSATRYKAEAKIARIMRHKTGAPGFEAPEQFARIINGNYWDIRGGEVYGYKHLVEHLPKGSVSPRP